MVSEAPTAVAKLPLYCTYPVVVIMRKDGEVEAKTPWKVSWAPANTTQQRDKQTRSDGKYFAKIQRADQGLV